MPFKVWSVGEEVLASDFNPYLQQQVVARFATAAARTAAITSPVLNQLTIRDDLPGVVEYWTGAAWAIASGTRELSYTQITASKTVTQTAEIGADTVITSPNIVCDGSPILVEFFSPSCAPANGVGAMLNSWLNMDGASLGRIGALQNNATALLAAPYYAARRLAPTAGSHWFAWAASQGGGNAVIAAGPGGVGQYNPAYLRVSRA